MVAPPDPPAPDTSEACITGMPSVPNRMEAAGEFALEGITMGDAVTWPLTEEAPAHDTTDPAVV